MVCTMRPESNGRLPFLSSPFVVLNCLFNAVIEAWQRPIDVPRSLAPAAGRNMNARSKGVDFNNLATKGLD